MAMIRLLAASLVLLSHVTWALEWEEVHLGVDESFFYFNVVVSGLPEVSTDTEFRLFTKAGVIVLADDQEQFLVDIDIPLNTILDGPRVEPIGIPDTDRWLDGAVSDFKSRKIVDGTWQFIGSITQGENPYQPGDQLGEIRITDAGGSLIWTHHPIAAQPPPSLSVSKASSTRLVTTEGQVVTYVYEIRNTGQVVLNDVNLTDDNVDAPPFCEFGWDDSLEVPPNPESFVICSARHTVTALEIEEDGTLDNTATATADEAEPAIASLSIPIAIFSSGFEDLENVISVVDDTNVRGTNSIALGSDDLPVISYMDHDLAPDLATLKVAKCHNAVCTDTSVALVDGASNAIDNWMAIGDDGFPVISYVDHDPDLNTGELKVAKCNDAACSGGDETISTVDDQEDTSFRDTSIAIGLDGLPVISYRDGTAGKLKVAKCNDASCSGGDESISTINDATESAGWYSTIAVAPDGFPIISYKQLNNPWGSTLKVAKCNDTDCAGEDETITAITNSGGFVYSSVSIAIGADGLPVLAYRELDTALMFVAKCNDVACSGNDETATAVGSAVGTGNLALAVGADEFPILTYFENSALRVVKCTDANCSSGDVVSTIVDDLHRVGFYNSIIVGADGMPVISYLESSSGALKVIHCGTASCK